MPTVLITGGSRGLGAATSAVLRRGGLDVVAPPRAELELASLASVRAWTGAAPPVDVVVCNAGLQLLDGPTRTADGLEQTLQVNQLAHVLLVDLLLARGRPPSRVVWLGSGTHDPARRTGIPDPVEGGVDAAAADDEPGARAGRRRYATSKLLNVATAAALARERPDVHVTAFDPGLMPGTGLARQAGPVGQVLWHTVARAARVLPGVSSARASGGALARLAAGAADGVPSGAYLDFRGRVARPSVRAADPAFQDAVLADSRRLVAAGRAEGTE